MDHLRNFPGNMFVTRRDNIGPIGRSVIGMAPNTAGFCHYARTSIQDVTFRDAEPSMDFRTMDFLTNRASRCLNLSSSNPTGFEVEVCLLKLLLLSAQLVFI